MQKTMFHIKVIPSAKAEKVVEMDGERERTGERKLKVYVKAPADKGKANQAVCKVLAGFLGVKAGNIEILHGHRSREKVVKVDNKKDLYT